VAPRQYTDTKIGFTIPEQCHPVPDNLPAPVTYTGYTLAQWKKAMKVTGCDQMACYQTKKRKKSKKQEKETYQVVATALHALESGKLNSDLVDEEDEEVECEVTIIGAIRGKRGEVKVAVRWEEDGVVTSESWIPIGDLNNSAPGTENHKASFGQGREGEVIIVQWQSTRRYVAELHSWNWDEDTFELVYESQNTNTALKTSQTDRQTHSFRLDTLATSGVQNTTHHSWWVCAKYASRPFIVNMFKVLLLLLLLLLLSPLLPSSLLLLPLVLLSFTLSLTFSLSLTLPLSLTLTYTLTRTRTHTHTHTLTH
jgi:hypothetical protein